MISEAANGDLRPRIQNYNASPLLYIAVLDITVIYISFTLITAYQITTCASTQLDNDGTAILYESTHMNQLD